MDIVFAIIGFILGFVLAKSKTSEPSTTEEHLREENKRLTEDVSYYKKLCKSISEENAEFRRKLK
jgi:hypothetical protein